MRVPAPQAQNVQEHQQHQATFSNCQAIGAGVIQSNGQLLQFEGFDAEVAAAMAMRMMTGNTSWAGCTVEGQGSTQINGTTVKVVNGATGSAGSGEEQDKTQSTQHNGGRYTFHQMDCSRKDNFRL